MKLTLDIQKAADEIPYSEKGINKEENVLYKENSIKKFCGVDDSTNIDPHHLTALF